LAVVPAEIFGNRAGSFMNYTIPSETLAASRHVFSTRIDGGIVFVKKRRPGKNPLGRLVQHILYRATGNPLIIPTLWTSESNVSIEVSRIRLLGGLGVRVPRVLHVEEDYFVMSGVGRSLCAVMKDSPGRAREYGERAVAALRDFHALGQAHGGAQIKNLTLLDDVIHFIDFEEALPADRLAEFQLRDLFLMLLSMERHSHDPDLESLCRVYDGGAHALTRIRDALLGLRVIRFLDSRAFGMLSMRDIRSLIGLVRKAERIAPGKPALP
jgi:tRNA A-37 threonylcarbamoyl transferase component Bud32